MYLSFVKNCDVANLLVVFEVVIWFFGKQKKKKKKKDLEKKLFRLKAILFYLYVKKMFNFNTV